MKNSIQNSIQKRKGLTVQNRKSLSNQIGVTRFELATSWSRTKSKGFSKSCPESHFTSQVVFGESGKNQTRCTQDALGSDIDKADNSRNGIARCFLPLSAPSAKGEA
jgi:hypothetical protein